MNAEKTFKVGTDEFRELFYHMKRAMRLTAKLNLFTVDDTEEINRLFVELIGKEVGNGFFLIPPFYSDYGLNLKLVKMSLSIKAAL